MGSLVFGSKYSKTCIKRPLSKRQKIGFQDRISLNAGQMYCRMLQCRFTQVLLYILRLTLTGTFIFVILFMHASSKSSGEAARMRNLSTHLLLAQAKRTNFL